MRIHELKPKYFTSFPKKKEPGILYISYEFELAVHLCACGCGVETVTPFNDPDGWTLKVVDGKVTLRPSIGNWAGEKPTYHAHYYITENKIEWLK